MSILHDDDYTNLFSPLKPKGKSFFDENSYAPPTQLEFDKEKVIDITQKNTPKKPIVKKKEFGSFSFCTENAFKAVDKIQFQKGRRCLDNLAYREFMVDKEGVIVTVFTNELRYIRITPKELKEFIVEARSLLSDTENTSLKFRCLKKEKASAMKHLFITAKLCKPDFHNFIANKPKTFIDDVIKLINEMHTYNVCYKFGKKRDKK